MPSNVSRTPKNKHWIFTLNNPTPAEMLLLRGYVASQHATYMSLGREVGDTGTRHIQGFISFTNRQRLTAVKKLLPRAHWEIKAKRSTLTEAIAYTQKDGDFEEIGDRPVSQGHRSDLLAIQSELQRGTTMSGIADQFFVQWVQYRRSFEAYAELQISRRTTPPKIIVLEGSTGVGKTRFAYEYGALNGGVWISNDPTLAWFDGYRQQQTAILDDFDGKGASYRQLLRITDRYPVDVPVKGSFTKWIPQTIFITTNVSIEEWFPEDNVAPLRRRVDWHFMGAGEYNFEELLTRFGLERGE